MAADSRPSLMDIDDADDEFGNDAGIMLSFYTSIDNGVIDNLLSK